MLTEELCGRREAIADQVDNLLWERVGWAAEVYRSWEDAGRGVLWVEIVYHDADGWDSYPYHELQALATEGDITINVYRRLEEDDTFESQGVTNEN